MTETERERTTPPVAPWNWQTRHSGRRHHRCGHCAALPRPRQSMRHSLRYLAGLNPAPLALDRQRQLSRRVKRRPKKPHSQLPVRYRITSRPRSPIPGVAVCRFPADKGPPVFGRGGPPPRVTIGAWPVVFSGMGGRTVGAMEWGAVGESRG
jgi:hypothetical protein